MLYYRVLGKKVVLTVHNVNAGKRDLNDSSLNRFRFGIVTLCHHFYPYRSELVNNFAFRKQGERHPFGINNTVQDQPDEWRGEANARRADNDKALLLWKHRAYKGLEYLVSGPRSS